jgi:hypothetical protein
MPVYQDCNIFHSETWQFITKQKQPLLITVFEAMKNRFWLLALFASYG